jgi:peptidoglycan/LPS O-acetylase OafA/YrhL
MRYIPQLDSLRAIAIVSVVVAHWFPKDSFLYALSSAINAPSFFFTLSGFLITAILIKAKDNRHTHNISITTILKDFYIKRSLRLFPGYFLVVGTWWFTKPGNEPFSLVYFATFTSNIYTWKIQQWPALAHLWSMAVEEQFYLCWPLVVLFTNRRYLAPVILVFTGIGLIWQQFYMPNEYAGVRTLSCLDCLSIGALLAYILRYQPDILRRYYALITVLAGLSLMLVIVQVAIYDAEIIRNRTLVSIITFWIITFFVIKGDAKNYLFSQLLKNRLLMQVGKISYGIYLYHFILPYFTNSYFIKLNTHLFSHAPTAWENNILLAENFVVLLGLSYLSYYHFELPVQSLKRFFTAPAGTTAVSRRQINIIQSGSNQVTHP